MHGQKNIKKITGIHVTVPVTNQTFAENSSSGNQQINHVRKIHSHLWFGTFNVPVYLITSHVFCG
jgi:hypothetical protein